MEDPVIKTVSNTLDLFKTSIAEVLVKTEAKFITLDRLANMQSVLLNGIIKGGEKNLKSKEQRDVLLHLHNECQKTMGVVLKGCKDYGIKYGTTSIPDIIVKKVIEETQRQINNQ